MKKVIKNLLVKILGWQVRRLTLRNNFKTIGVVGSIGKTSTKLAIGQILSSFKKVCYQEGNYNDILSVPLVFFGRSVPTLWNVFAWIKILIHNEIQIYSKYSFEIVVLELGTDAPGQIIQFRNYLNLDIAVVTAVTPEHMEFFENLQSVAEEEWSVSYFSNVVFANKDLCKISPQNIDHKKIIYYGKDFGSVYKIDNVLQKINTFSFDIFHNSTKFIEINYEGVSEVQLYTVSIAVILASRLGLSQDKIKDSVNKISGMPGRMQKLSGINKSTIIDDTYNASPEAVRIALDTLYSYPSTQRIAIIGSMNELGSSSTEEHKKIGNYCDPKLLDLVVTIGEHANKFIYPVAKSNGCNVYQSKNAVDAGKYVAEYLKDGAVILAKGSQNGVFAEESLKPLLSNPLDVSKLVRQDKNWMDKKAYLYLGM